MFSFLQLNKPQLKMSLVPKIFETKWNFEQITKVGPCGSLRMAIFSWKHFLQSTDMPMTFWLPLVLYINDVTNFSWPFFIPPSPQSHFYMLTFFFHLMMTPLSWIGVLRKYFLGKIAPAQINFFFIRCGSFYWTQPTPGQGDAWKELNIPIFNRLDLTIKVSLGYLSW